MTTQRPLGLSWLEARIYDALLPVGSRQTVKHICQKIEEAEQSYRTTESSVSRLLYDLERRGIVIANRDNAKVSWSLATMNEQATTRPPSGGNDDRPIRNHRRQVSMSCLTSHERRVLRAIREEQPCSRSCVARSANRDNRIVGLALTRLTELGIVEQNGAGLWQTTTADA